MAGAMDTVAVEFKLAGQRSVCSLLAVHQQHARAPARKPSRTPGLVSIVGQSLPSRTEEGHTREARTTDDP
jgi:hypothetical protein